jgi:hypothetical protein
MAVTFVLIESKTAANSSISTYTFSSIPDTYTDLALFSSCRSANSNYGGYQIRINGQNSNQGYQFFRGYSGTKQANYRTDMIDVAQLPITNTANGVFSADQFYFPNYSTTVMSKSFTADSGNMYNTNDYSLRMSGATQWATTKISSIDVTLDTDTFLSGSTFQLYGIKNS